MAWENIAAILYSTIFLFPQITQHSMKFVKAQDGSLSRGSTHSVATTWPQGEAWREVEGNGGIQCKTSITMINRLGYFIATHCFCEGESFRTASLFVAPNKFCRKYRGTIATVGMEGVFHLVPQA